VTRSVLLVFEKELNVQIRKAIYNRLDTDKKPRLLFSGVSFCFSVEAIS
jgi:hypothetical protein